MPAKTDKPSTSKVSKDDVLEEVESWLDKVTNSGDNEMTKQMLFGGLSGWLSGFLLAKVGKVAAMSIGGGIILIQVANYKGYININWSRINKEVERVSKEMQTEVIKKQNWTDKMERKMEKAIDKAESVMNQGNRRATRWYNKFLYGEDLRSQELQAFLISFAAGIGLGVIMGHF